MSEIKTHTLKLKNSPFDVTLSKDIDPSQFKFFLQFP